MLREVFAIEFIGGPFDGHEEICVSRPADLAADVVWLVGKGRGCLLGGRRRKWSSAVTSVALYELVLDTGSPRYQFVGAISAAEVAELMRNT